MEYDEAVVHRAKRKLYELGRGNDDRRYRDLKGPQDNFQQILIEFNNKAKCFGQALQDVIHTRTGQFLLGCQSSECQN